MCRWLRLLFVVSLLAGDAGQNGHAADVYTPIVVSSDHAVTQVFPGTDRKQHIVYELKLTNATRQPVPLQKMEVVDARDSSKVLASYEGAALLSHLRRIANGASESADLEANGSRFFFVDLALEAGAAPPSRLMHRLTVLSTAPGSGEVAAPMTYAAAPVGVLTRVLTIGPPLSGSGWVAINGCCEPGGAHRSTGLPVNGEIHFAQRFAIDWMKLDRQGQFVHGDETDVHDYTDYGADVIAVADGTIIETLNGETDRKPPDNPDPKTITLVNISGNHMIEDLGGGVFALYAHMQRGSIKAAPGDRVKRGQVLGRLGNTGNTSAPHLHFHLMDGPSMLGSSGLPYVIDSFAVAGKLSAEQFAAATSLAGSWSAGVLAAPSPRHDEFPMDTAIVNFTKN